MSDLFKDIPEFVEVSSFIRKDLVLTLILTCCGSAGYRGISDSKNRNA
jgi:hypothetical protein